MANNTTILPLLSPTERMVFNVLLPVISVIGIATNLIVILGVLYNRSIRNVPANIFVINLAIADFFVVVIGVPLWVIQLSLAEKITINQGTTLCQINFGLSVFTSVLSVYTLGIISYDRYAAVTAPFRYHEVMSPSTTYKILAAAWTMTLVFSLPAMIGWKSDNLKTPMGPYLIGYCVYTKFFSQEYQIIVYSGISLTIVMNIVLYTRLLNVAKRHARQIASTKHEVENSYGEQSGMDTNKRSPPRRERNIKAAKALGIVLGALLSCWVPFLIVAYIDAIVDESGISVFTMKVLGTMTYFNSVMNPLIYTYMSRDFRKTVRKMLLRKRGHQNYPGNSST